MPSSTSTASTASSSSAESSDGESSAERNITPASPPPASTAPPAPRPSPKSPTPPPRRRPRRQWTPPAMSLSTLAALQRPVAERVAERYITAIYSTKTVSSSAPPQPIRASALDEAAYELVVNRDELRRVYALHTLACCVNHSYRDLRVVRLLRYLYILMGYRLHPELQLEYLPTRGALRVLANRFSDANPVIGASTREARDALAAAAWGGMARRKSVFNLLNGEETVARLREQGQYVDDPGLESDDEEQTNAEDSPAPLKGGDYLSALRELPDTEKLPFEVLHEIARKVEDFSVLLRQAPPMLRTEDVFEFLQKTGRFERETGRSLLRQYRVAGRWRLKAPGKVKLGTWLRPDGPSGIPYRMALYRTEALKRMASVDLWREMEGKKLMERQLRDAFKTEAVGMHPFVWRTIRYIFSSVDEVAEDLSQLGHFGELLGARKRKRLFRALQQNQVELLLSQMAIPNRSIAANMIAHFRSARRSLRTSLIELEWLFRDKEAAHSISQHVHGFHPDCFRALVRRVRLPYLVSRVICDEFCDLAGAQRASFAAFVQARLSRPDATDKRMAGEGLALNADERLAAYQAVHGEGLDDCQEAWAMFEASWGLFQEVCARTTVRDSIAVTAGLLDETQSGAGVLSRLAKDTVDSTCLRVPGLNTDDVVALRTFAYSFVPREASIGTGGFGAG